MGIVETNISEIKTPNLPDPNSEEVKLWRTTLLQLPDRLFFDIIRNYLGPVQTPYNKHDLIKRLESFLRREDIQETIGFMTTPDEGSLIAALSFMGPSTGDEIVRYLGDSLPPLQVYRSLITLEDRLIIYKTNNGKLWFNPWLESTVKKGFGNPTILFPSYPVEPTPAPVPWANDVSLLAIYSLTLTNLQGLKQDGCLNKKTVDLFKQRVPEFLLHQSRIEWALQGLMVLGVLVREEEDSKELLSVPTRWDQLFSLSPRDRIYQWWAALFAASDICSEFLPSPGTMENSGEALLWVNDISFFDLDLFTRITGVIGGFLAQLPSDRAYDESTLNRIFDSLYPNFSPGMTPIIRGLIFLQALIPYISKDPKPGKTLYHKNPNLEQLSSESPDHDFPGKTETIRSGGLIVSPDGSVTIQGWVPANRIYPLMPLFHLKKADYIIHGEIIQEGAQRLFRKAILSEDVIRALELLAGHPLPQNLKSTLTQWEKEFFSVQAQRGILLHVDPQRESRLLHDPRAKELLIQSLKPGLCFVPTQFNNEQEINAVLLGIGIPLDKLLPEMKVVDPGFPEIKIIPLIQPKGTRALSRILTGSQTVTKALSPVEAQKKAHKIKQALKEKLETLKVNEDTRRELELRIDMGLILSQEQLQSGISRPEHTQASGLDHTGKLRLIEAAIKFKDLLEIRLPASPGLEQTELLVDPKFFHAKGKIASFMAIILPEGKSLDITVSKIQHIRRLKGGLFK